jgi:GNAT superfamily N-acetyltransferase
MAQDYAADEVLRDGEPMHIRAIRPDDKRALVDMFERLSPKTIYFRFHGAKKRLSRKELVYLTELDFHRRAALLAVLGEEKDQRIVAVGRYAVAPRGADDRAEVALTVEDAEQGRGIGTLLLRHLVHVAYNEGIEKLDAYVLSENVSMLQLFHRSGRVVQQTAEGGACHIVLTTAPTGD